MPCSRESRHDPAVASFTCGFGRYIRITQLCNMMTHQVYLVYLFLTAGVSDHLFRWSSELCGQPRYFAICATGKTMTHSHSHSSRRTFYESKVGVIPVNLVTRMLCEGRSWPCVTLVRVEPDGPYTRPWICIGGRFWTKGPRS